MKEEVGCLSRFRDAFGCGRNEFIRILKKQEKKRNDYMTEEKACKSKSAKYATLFKTWDRGGRR